MDEILSANEHKSLWSQGLDIYDLYYMELPPLEWVVNDLLPKGGAAILASPPKRRKSFLVFDLCVSVALGRPFLGHDTTKGKTLYLALEDGDTRLKRRLTHILCQDSVLRERCKTLIVAPRLDEGLLESIRASKAEEPELSLVVIDVFQRIRQPGQKTNDYQLDYGTIAPINDLATELGITILLVHHTRKNVNEDEIFDSISGSNGLLGAVTTAWLLDGKENEPEATLHITGKDVEPEQVKLRFDRTSLRFEPAVDVNQLKRESPNALVRVASRLLERHGGQWQGTAAGFQDFALSQPEYRGTERTPTSFGRELAGDTFRQAALVERIGIARTKGKIRLFWYEGVQAV